MNIIENCNYRAIFIENKGDQFYKVLFYHNQIINIINKTPVLMPGSKSFLIHFFSNRNYFWVGSEVVGVSTELQSEDVFYYDLMNRRALIQKASFKLNDFNIENILNQGNDFIANNNQNLNKNSFQMAIKQDNSMLSCEYIFFEKY